LAKDEAEAARLADHYKKLAKERKALTSKVTKPQRPVQSQSKKHKAVAPVVPKVEKKKTPEKPKVETKKAPEKKPEAKTVKSQEVKKPEVKKPEEKVAKKKPQIAIPEPPVKVAPRAVKKKPEVQQEKAPKATKKQEIAKKPSMYDVLLEKVNKFGFSLAQYLHSIGGTESRHHYGATNVQKGEALNIESDKHAYGKYQFTLKTLASFGIKTPEQIEEFLRNPKLQERIMVSFTM